MTSNNKDDVSLALAFADKQVLNLTCKFCENHLCDRAMRAILLADKNTHLYSTDLPLRDVMEPVFEPYLTLKCTCYIRDTACLQCGNVVGYNVTEPCRSCIQSCHNGHYWMFHSTAVEEQLRLDVTGERMLLWGDIFDKTYPNSTTANQEECQR